MFWRKKQPPSELFTHESDDRRASFRLKLDRVETILIQLAGQSIPLIDIGANGISFLNHGFQAGKSHKVQFSLPNVAAPIKTRIKILSIDKDDICHCRFMEIDPDMEENIHQFMLQKQKEILRNIPT